MVHNLPLLVAAGGSWWLLVAAGACWWLLVAAGGCWRRHGHTGAGQLGHAVAGRRAADLGPGGEENAGWRDALQHVGAGGCRAVELRRYII